MMCTDIIHSEFRKKIGTGTNPVLLIQQRQISMAK